MKPKKCFGIKGVWDLSEAGEMYGSSSLAFTLLPARLPFQMTDGTQLTLCSAPDMDDDAVFVCYYGVETHGTSRCADPSVPSAGWQLHILCSATHPSRHQACERPRHWSR